MMTILSSIAAVLIAAISPPELTAQQILARMSLNTAGLETYVVPVVVHARVKKIISIGVSISGTRYFKAPDEGALKLRSVPAVAKTFSNLYSSLGTPATWPATYNVQSVSTVTTRGRPAYELRATYKHPSRVDHVVLDVDAQTFDPVQARWFYTNGATISMSIVEGAVGGKYRLPLSESLQVRFPDYAGDASIQYGAYQINVDIPDSTFSAAAK